MKVLSKSDIAAIKRPPLPVPVPRLGEDCGVCIRFLGGHEREEILAEIKGISSDYEVAARVVARCVCVSQDDETRMFGDAAEVASCIADPDVVLFVGRESLRINGLLRTSLDDAKKN